MALRKGYGIPDLKADLANLYQKAGLKNLGTVFLMTDAQVADEKFLVLINNLLASGEIPELFVDDEVENIVTMVRNEVKGAGLQDTKENCWRFFIDRVRRQLKVSNKTQISTTKILRLQLKKTLGDPLLFSCWKYTSGSRSKVSCSG